MNAPPAGAAGIGDGIRVVNARALQPAEIAAWSALQKADPVIASPFFRPEFTAVVADARDDTLVGIVEESGEFTAFFPFHRDASGHGRPVGDQLSDYHSIIARRGLKLNACRLLRACGLKDWQFDHLPPGQGIFERFRSVETFSPSIDLAGEGESHEVDYQRRWRRLEREAGSATWEWNSADPAALNQLMQWKSEQYVKSGKRDNFSLPWVRQVVERIHGMEGPDFGGVLSVLRAGGRIAAVHFGMRSGSTLHSWFPAYDPALAKLSPGTLLLMGIVMKGREHGIDRIDLGKGKAFYKERLTNHTTPLIEGTVPASTLRATVTMLCGGLKERLRTMRAWARPASTATAD